MHRVRGGEFEFCRVFAFWKASLCLTSGHGFGRPLGRHGRPQGGHAAARVKDVTDNNQRGLRELEITPKPRAYQLGMTRASLLSQVRQGFFGSELQRGRDEVRV